MAEAPRRLCPPLLGVLHGVFRRRRRQRRRRYAFRCESTSLPRKFSFIPYYTTPALSPAKDRGHLALVEGRDALDPGLIGNSRKGVLKVSVALL